MFLPAYPPTSLPIGKQNKNGTVVRVSGEGTQEAGELHEEGGRNPHLEGTCLSRRCGVLRVSTRAPVRTPFQLHES